MTAMCGEFCRVIILSGCLALVVQHAQAQYTSTSAGANFQHPNGPNRLHGPDGRQQLQDKNELNNQHLTSTGKPCIALESYSTAELINKKIFEHWVQASNNCGQHIKLQVCYHATNDCIVMNVPPWETANSVLGIYPNVKEFQYDAKEK